MGHSLLPEAGLPPAKQAALSQLLLRLQSGPLPVPPETILRRLADHDTEVLQAMLVMPAIYAQMVAAAAAVPDVAAAASVPGGPGTLVVATAATQPPPADDSGVPAAICAAADAIPIAAYLARHPGVHRNEPPLAYLSLPYLSST